MADNDEFDNEQIRPYIIACHGPLEDLRPVLESEPRLLRSCWHWGGGDWESGMDAAGHMGHPDVARFLMDRGATLHAYAAASMGLTDVVRSMVEADPKVVNRPGVHGMSMLLHVSMSGDTELAGYLHQQARLSGSIPRCTERSLSATKTWCAGSSITEPRIFRYRTSRASLRYGPPKKKALTAWYDY